MGGTYVSFICRYDHPGSFSDRRHCVHPLGEKTMMTHLNFVGQCISDTFFAAAGRRGLGESRGLKIDAGGFASRRGGAVLCPRLFAAH